MCDYQCIDATNSFFAASYFNSISMLREYMHAYDINKTTDDAQLIVIIFMAYKTVIFKCLYMLRENVALACRQEIKHFMVIGHTSESTKTFW